MPLDLGGRCAACRSLPSAQISRVVLILYVGSWVNPSSGAPVICIRVHDLGRVHSLGGALRQTKVWKNQGDISPLRCMDGQLLTTAPGQSALTGQTATALAMAKSLPTVRLWSQMLPTEHPKVGHASKIGRLSPVAILLPTVGIVYPAWG